VKRLLMSVCFVIALTSMSFAITQADIQGINAGVDKEAGYYSVVAYKNAETGELYKYLYEDATTIYVCPFESGQLQLQGDQFEVGYVVE